MTGFERERVETLLRERSAEMTRTRTGAGRPYLDEELHERLPLYPAPVFEVALDETCIDCGDLILPARLKALPGAVRCVSCQREFEARSG